MTTGARLRIDLARFRRNVAAVRERMAPADVLVVVKDDAYGHGVEPIVRAAVDAGATWFGAIDPASALRAKAVAGDAARVFSWLTATDAEVAEMLAAGLELGVGDAGYLERVAETARGGEPAPVHLKIDTGLHRNGIRPEAWPSVCARAAELEAAGDIRVVGLWSHIAEASDDEDDASRAVFDGAVAQARAVGLAPAVRHLAASAAAWHRPEFRYDLVRIGAFCYGVRSADGPELEGLEAVATLTAPVTAVGGGTATVDIGSADGVFSTWAGRVDVAAPGGRRALESVGPFDSRVAAWPGAAIGDEVAIFGARADGAPTSTDQAEAIDTVGEEPLLRLSSRIRREYV
ncbi:alanine racemase [Microbacterium halophytorum]|uniref:alanine racemase n=1 Tax=Microbacterium halophytorum TaxID=2067568 RepID=UPI000CFCD823|nr:alanine racemase [Microbacterium halophytorum]